MFRKCTFFGISTVVLILEMKNDYMAMTTYDYDDADVDNDSVDYGQDNM